MPYKVQKSGDKHCVVVSAGPKKGKQVACHDTRQKAVAQVKALYANDAAYLNDVANKGLLVPCYEESCVREFYVPSAMYEHAEAVHTFDDLRKLVHEVIREKYGRTGDYHASPPVPGIWTWIEDMATDWVVFTVEEGNETTLYRSSYVVVDTEVTLGEPVEVRRRTVYEPVKKQDDDD